jgi:putative oxidoreductase
MMNVSTTLPSKQSFSPIKVYASVLSLAEYVPLAIVQVASRVAIAHVFWNSAQSKLASWPVTLQLFALEYRVPILSPDVAAMMATGIELSGAILILLGLFTRIAAFALLGVVAVIQLFVFPGSWGEHLLWACLLLLLFARGAGFVSLDYVTQRLFLGRA